MGVKRPLEEKNFPELSFKQPKQIDSEIKLTFTTDDLSSHKTSQTVDTPGETNSNCRESNDEVVPENSDMNDASGAHKELEASAPLDLATELGARAPLPLATELGASAPLPFATESEATELEASASIPLATELEAGATLPLATKLEANIRLPLVPELEAYTPLPLATELGASAPLPFATESEATELEASASIPLATELEAGAMLPLATKLEASIRLPLVPELEANTPLPLVTSSSSEEDSGDENSSFMYNLPGFVDLSIPWRTSDIYQDPYAVLLNSSPRKEVSIGPEHQAEVPQWDQSSSRKDISKKAIDGNREQEMMGTTVIPLPTSFDSSIEGGAVGRGRTECSCLDAGSMRCVQQHVMEAREKLHETIGEDAFAKLGFYEMGEEVAANWTPEDEQLFHVVVFSNPASHGSNFWKHLGDAFPNQSKKELVSYYFNVFMLRRRAVQNRSYLLQIDSDDDEDHSAAHGDASVDDEETDEENLLRLNPEDFNIGGEEDEDSAVESFDDEVLDEGWVDEYHSEPVNLPKFDGKDDTSGTPDGGNDNGSADKEEAGGEEPNE